MNYFAIIDVIYIDGFMQKKKSHLAENSLYSRGLTTYRRGVSCVRVCVCGT